MVWLLMLMLSGSLTRTLSVFCYVAGGLCCESASGRMSNRAKECGRVSVDDCTQKGVVIFFGNYKKIISRVLFEKALKHLKTNFTMYMHI